MPVMNGIEASIEINKLMADKELTHIVALTSYTNKENDCLKAGMKSLFNKPLMAKDLYKIVCLHFYRLSQTDYEIWEKRRYDDQRSVE